MIRTYQGIAKEASNDRAWHGLCEQVGRFCLRAGCPSVTNEPDRDIESLRAILLSTRSNSRENDLQAEVARLRDTCRKQQRIITNLSFRHALEALPDRSLTDVNGRPINSSTARWKRFWEITWNNATPNSGHPLSPLFDRFDPPTQRHIQRIGHDLYSILSTNIHHYNGEFAIDDDQWDVSQAAILHAITPTARNHDGSVDWDAERRRF